ncbi:MAG: hypothetical protein O3A47_04125 [Chloroflexi bacterium]|nr:hypothetical protein [Chloroflexota bacterium]
MANLTRNIPLTVPDAFVARVTAWITAMPPLMQDSGQVDANGDPIMEEVSENLPQRFDRVAKELLTYQIRKRVREWEIRQQQAITEIEVN